MNDEEKKIFHLFYTAITTTVRIRNIRISAKMENVKSST